MKPIRPYSAVAVLSVIFFALVPSVCAQEATSPRNTGVPQDWSQHHIVFSRDALARHPDLIDREPRIRYQATQRWQVPNFAVFQGADPLPVPPSANKSGLHRDWNMALAGHLLADTFPAKYSFDPDAPPDCTNDYVVFGLAVPETAGTAGTNANLVGFNNLYVDGGGDGFCTGTDPTALFAYNITTVAGGRISTSPVLSEDGKKIAFVESVPANFGGSGNPASAIFHVLTWAAGGSLIAASAPTIGCEGPGCMTSVPLTATANDTTSSPWVDYGADTAYVGTDNGEVWQIVGVFKSASALGGSPWPITLHAGFKVSSPVLDGRLGFLMIGSFNGNLYQINLNTSPPTLSAPLEVGFTGATTPGIVAPPIVDISNGTTFVVSDYGAFAFGSGNTFAAVLVQVDTATMSVLQVVNLGLGSTGVTHPAPVLRLFEPAFSNEYYTDPSNASSLISLCGTGVADTSPSQYTFGFTQPGGPGTQPLMNAAPNTGFPLQLSTSTTDRCTGWTEFLNPNASPDNITATSVASNVLTVTTTNSNLTVGEEVVIQGTAEAFLNGRTVVVASLIGTAPTYTGFTANFTAADYPTAPDTGTVSVPPITATSVATDVLTVTANNSNLTVGEQVYIQGTAEDFLNGQTVTVASLIGTGPAYTGFTANFTAADYSNPADTGTVSLPTDFFFFGLTGDCTLVGGVGASTTGCVVALANNNGTTSTTTAAVNGGPSGIIVDNYSSAAQASSIYFTAETLQTAYKFTQNALQ
ncbi:MAG TPA: hypothetical protein VJX30_07435 [Terriglobales bacterium]|nr:hypothetical protein [Terriglobales bacterium]